MGTKRPIPESEPKNEQTRADHARQVAKEYRDGILEFLKQLRDKMN